MTTSIHYFDHTAHEYMRAVCEDLGMRYAQAISLDMLDLEIPDRRRNIRIFAENFFEAIEDKTTTARHFKPLTFSDFVYQPNAPADKVDTRGKKILVLTDGYDSGTNMGKMIDRFRQSFSGEIELVDLNDIDMRNACMGCMRCGYDYVCVQKDGYAEFYNNRVRSADIIVFAGTMRGRYLSSIWKTFYDRAFFWNHTPSLVGKQLAYIISGPLSQNANLMQILEASVTARQEANLVDMITDECEDSEEIDAFLQDLAERAVSYSVKGYIKPQNFLAVGGHKIFRDDIWGRIRMVWQADHRYFKKHGKYDFPQKDRKVRFANLIVTSLTRIPKFRKIFYENAVKHPKKQLEKIVEESND
jgi:multimeric flavodoxin WrbA